MKNTRGIFLFFLLFGCLFWFTTFLGPASVFYVFNWTVPKWNLSYKEIDGSFFSGIELSNFRIGSIDTASVIQSKNLNISFFPWRLKSDRVDASLNRNEEIGSEKLNWEKTVGRLKIWLPELEISQLGISIKNNRYSKISKIVGSMHYKRDGDMICVFDSILVGDISSITEGYGKLNLRVNDSNVYFDSLDLRIDSGKWDVKLMSVGSLDLSNLQLNNSKFDLILYSDGDRIDAMGDVRGSIRTLELESRGMGTISLNSGISAPWNFSIRTDPTELAIDSLFVEVGGGIIRLEGRSLFGAKHLEFNGTLDSLAVLGGNGGIMGGTLDGSFDLSSKQFSAVSNLEFKDVKYGEITPFGAIIMADRDAHGNANWSIESKFLNLLANGHIDSNAPWLFNFKGSLKPSQLFPDDGWKEVQLEGTIDDTGVDMILEVPKHLNVVGDLFGELAIDLNWIFESKKVKVNIVGPRLSGTSVFDVQKNYVDTLYFASASMDIDKIVPDVKGLFEASISGSGPMHADSISCSYWFRSDDLRPFNWNIGRVLGSGRWDQGRFLGKTRGSGWKVRSVFSDDEGWKIDGDFQELVIRQGMSNSLVVVGEMLFKSGTPTKNLGSGTFKVDRLDYSNGLWSMSANSPFRIGYNNSNGEWHLGTVKLDSPIGTFQAHGSYSPENIKLEAKLDNMTLKSLPDWDLSTGGGFLLIHGTPRHPVGKGWLAAKNLRVENRLLGSFTVEMMLKDSLHAQATFQQRMREVGSVNTSFPSEILSRNELSESNKIQLGASFDGLNLSAALSRKFQENIRGTVSAKTEVQIPMLRSNSNYVFLWEKMRGFLEIDMLEVDMAIDDDSLRAELAEPIQVVGYGDSLTLDDIIVDFSRYDWDNDDYGSSGRIKFKGSLSKMSAMKLNIDLNDFSTQNIGLPDGSIDAELRLHEKADRLDLRTKFSAETDDWGRFDGEVISDSQSVEWLCNWTTTKFDTLRMQGGVPWEADGWGLKRKDGWARVVIDRLDLSAFSRSFIDIRPLSGIAVGSVYAEGLDSDFTLSGEVKFDGIQMHLLGLDPILPLPDGRVSFSERTGILNTETRYDTDAYESMDLEGIIKLDTVVHPYWDVKMRTIGLKCLYGDVFRADEIDAELKFMGDSQYSALSGAVALTNPIAEPVFVELNALSLPPPPPTLKNPFLENMRLNVDVDVYSLSVDSELAQILVSGGLGIGGTFYKPIFQGDASIEEGRVIILGRSFEMEPSNVVFDGIEPTRSLIDVMYNPLQLDPELDLRASTKIVDGVDTDQEYTINMSLEGSATRVSPSFRSTPELDFNRVVNLLAFGTTEIDGFNYGTAIGAAAGQLLRKRVERTGIDEFSIVPSTKIIGVEPGETVVRMGKLIQIPFSVWVRYEAALSRMGQGEVRLEHRLNSLLTLTGAAQSEYEQYGIGVGLKKEF